MTIKHIPKVSIGMPVYNGQKYIREALNSLLAQTFTDFELIISDNASTDGTETICREYVAKDSRIRYIRQPENRGAMANFQLVLDEAIGEYFMWAAADDRRHPKFIAFASLVLNDDLSVGLVFSDMYTEDLITGEKIYSIVGYSGARSKYKNYLHRLLNSCPSLIYGLHRINVLRKIKLEGYDFFDVHLSHRYELTSVVKTIPLALFTAGTNGIRIPYSLTGKKVSPRKFLGQEWCMLCENLNFGVAIILYGLVCFLYIKNARNLNLIIKGHA